MTSKITIISYIGTYYAIGAAWILTIANYFAIGWFNGYLDKYYIDSWKVWFSIVIVFNGLGNFALATMRYRIGERSWFGSLLENLKWTLMLAIFLGGLSLHVSQALLAHMFEIDMSWVSFCPPYPNTEHSANNLLGRHLQRSRVQQLFHRSAESPQVLQVQHESRTARNRHYGDPGCCTIRALRLADQGLHRHPPDVDGVCQPLPTSDRAQSGVDDVYFLSDVSLFPTCMAWSVHRCFDDLGGLYRRHGQAHFARLGYWFGLLRFADTLSSSQRPMFEQRSQIQNK